MKEQFLRTALLIDKLGIEKLNQSSVAVFGVGGVGSFAIEALARAGIGSITIIDDDSISISNINRQLIALHSTIGRDKVDVMKERILDINPDINIYTYNCFYTKENADDIDLSKFDYVIDAIDTVSSKLELICRCENLNIPIISSMGTGNKLDPSKLEITDINKTSMCPLARVIRRELKKLHINKLNVIYSTEEPIAPLGYLDTADTGLHKKRQTSGSVSFVPSVAGLMLAGFVVRELI